MTATTDDAPLQPTRRPKYTRFTQQELPAYKPLLTPAVVVSLFVIIGAVFLGLGYACTNASQQVVEVTQRYDDTCLPGTNATDREQDLQLSGNGSQCAFALTAPAPMAPPIFLYYELDNFFQNHRRYVGGRNDAQLRGIEESPSGLKSCDPELYLGGNTSEVIDPCGIVAWSYFNDTYQVLLEGAPVLVDATGIAWQSDIDSKFANVPPSNFNTAPDLRGGGTINGSLQGDEHFIVWMRTAALRDFRKLWGRINTPIPAGTNITVMVQNRYNTYRFDGSKKVVLSTASWLGGANPFMGQAYYAVGGVSLLFAGAFTVLALLAPRKLGDNSRLSWNRRTAAAQ